MTPTFVSLAAIAVCVAIFFILLPLVRNANPERARIERQLEALDDLIDELDFKDYATRRKTLRARLDSVGGQRKVGFGMMAALALIIPIGTVFLYAQVGAPAGLTRIDAPVTELREELIRISNSIARDPDNSEHWTRIAIAYKHMSEFGSAAHAFRRALYIDEDNPFVKVELAETLMFMNQRPGMPAESRELLVEALTIDPDHQKGLWLMGVGASLDSEYQRAIAFWERLLALLDPGSNVYNSIVGQIGQARLALGQDPGEIPPSHSVPPLRAGQTGLPPGHPPIVGGAPRMTGPITRDAMLPPGHPQSPALARPGPVNPGVALPPSHPPIGAPAATVADDGRAPSFNVELNIAPALAAELNGNETVFVVARAADGPPTPLAVRRMTVADLPARISLSDKDAMVEGLNLSTFPEIVITARVSKNGGIDPRPGDLQGQTEPLSVMEVAGTRLTISERL